MSTSRGLAPIAIFCYRRPEHLSLVLDGLEKCPEFCKSPIFVFSDGPRDTRDASKVSEVRDLLSLRLRDNATLLKRETNWGLARNIVEGVTRLCDSHGRAIVVEDDIFVAPTFLTYMNAALNRYAGYERVSSVTGLSFGYPPCDQSSHFLPIISSWGWATWQRAWRCFDLQAVGWDELLRDRNLRYRFDFFGAYGFSTMLLSHMLGRNNSWAIRWYWSVFKRGGLTLFPCASLVSNIGLDGTGSHGRGAWRDFQIRVDNTFSIEQLIEGFPLEIDTNPGVLSNVRKALRRRNGGLPLRLADRARGVLIRAAAARLRH